MLRIFLWEQRLLGFREEGRLPPTYHVGRGHEAVAVGAAAALRRDDYIMYDHRGCGQVIAKGLSLTAAFGDIIGTVAGTTRGFGSGIVHIADPDLGILGQSGTLGGAFPIAAGAALSAKYRGTTQVCVCFFGDGASNRGQFHEAANAASAWKLPVVWMCENNGWAISTPVSESTSVADISTRAVGYGMPGVSVDGTDVRAVYEATRAAVERARAGDGPSMIEARVTRAAPHYIGDAQKYRPTDEIEAAKQSDPVQQLADRLLEDGVVSEADLQEIRRSVQVEVDEAAEEAARAPLATRARLEEPIYV